MSKAEPSTCDRKRDERTTAADLLLYGGHIYSRVEGPPVEALAVSRGRVIAGGSLREVEQFVRPGTRRLDLGGATALPGLSDSHLHLVAVGQQMQTLDLTDVRSEQELLSAVGRAADRLPPGAWLEGRGFDETRFPSRALPARNELDAVSGGRPVLLRRVCGHAALANSFALTASGLSASTPDPPGGRIGRDPITGSPTGVLWDAAIQLVTAALPEPTDAELEQAISLGMDAAIEAGLTSVHTEDLRYIPGVERTYRLYDNVLAGRAHSPRVLELVWYTYLDELNELARGCGIAGPGFGSDGASFAFGGVKMMADGALGARSARLREPYADAPGERGLALLDPQWMREVAATAARYGWPSAIHAIGDEAAEAAISAVEAAIAATAGGGSAGPGSLSGSGPLRHRLIHLQVLAPDLVERARRLPVVADIQPRFVGTDLHWVADRLGPSRLPHAYAWRKLLESGVRCAGGSDAPVEPVSPIEGIHAAVTRQDLSGTPPGGWLPAERLSVSQALSLFTEGPAYAARDEANSGTLLPGFRADVTVVDQDPFSVEHSALKDLRVVATIIGGDVAYERR